MNKCIKCGTEFEGNFCPACGTASDAPKVCPKCGATLKEDVKFCNNCGYSFFDRAPATTATNASWKENNVVRTVLKYAPFVLFALWAGLLWAFYTTPIMAGDGFLIENVNLYQLLKDETMSDMFAIARALICLGAVSCAYALIFALVQWKGNNLAKWVTNVASYALHIAIIICTIVLAVQFKEYVGDLEDVNGSFVAVVIALTAVFALLQTVASVLQKVTGSLPLSEAEKRQWFNSVISKITAPYKTESHCYVGCILCSIGVVFSVIALVADWLSIGSSEISGVITTAYYPYTYRYIVLLLCVIFGFISTVLSKNRALASVGYSFVVVGLCIAHCFLVLFRLSWIVGIFCFVALALHAIALIFQIKNRIKAKKKELL